MNTVDLPKRNLFVTVRLQAPGCRQYVHNTKADLIKWLTKKPHVTELIKVIEVVDSFEANKLLGPGAVLADHYTGKKLIK